MKKFLITLLALMLICIGLFAGCGFDINENTKPEDIVSDVVTETEWRKACRFIGMRDIQHIIDGGEIEDCDSVTVSFKVSQEMLDTSEFAEYNYIIKIENGEYEEDTGSSVITHEGIKVYAEVYTISKDGEENSDSGNYFVSVSQNINRYSNSNIYNHLSEFMSNITDEFAKFYYEEELKAYVNEEEGIKVKIKDSKIVAYSEGDEWLIFYNYNSTSVTFDSGEIIRK